MTENKPIMIDGVDVSGCKKLDREYAPNYPEIGGYDWFNECKETSTDCQGRNCLFKQLTRKTQECEELREYHNKCCEEFENEKKELLEKYNQLSRDFYSGKYCNVEKCKQLDQLKVDINKKELIFAGIEVSNRELIKELNQLKAENEDLKERFKKFHDRKLDENADLLCKLHKEECLRFKAEQKLEKIKDKCNETLELMDKDSGTNAYAGGRCTEAGQILQIIDEVEEQC